MHFYPTRQLRVPTRQLRVPEHQNERSGAFIVNSEHISHLVLVFLLLTLSR